jgi:hypothetical protein
MKREFEKVQAALGKAVASSLGPLLLAEFDEEGPVEMVDHAGFDGVNSNVYPPEEDKPEDKLYLVVNRVGARYSCWQDFGNTTIPFDMRVTPLQAWALGKACRLLDIPTQEPKPRWIMGVVHFTFDFC